MTTPVLLFSVPIFPEGSLASSVVTTVWVGVLVSVMLNLRLGWTLSGLVVPGYVAPLLIMKPVSAVVVFVEGALAYGMVWLFSEYLSRYRLWSNCFGRDRFFALILASIIVRIGLDGYLFPQLGRSLSVPWLSEFDLASNLQSFGLIIIALIANQFWKPGLRRGLFPIGVTLGITYLIVRYPLMEWTNFNIGRLEFMYEDVSASVFSSPKAYIILVCTAFIASRLNLRYSWEFNGIMIPSLLALQWHQPFKILTSFVEAWVIYGAAILVLRIPIFREMTIEGGRKVLLFFNISFLYKLIIGHVLLRVAPEVQVTDAYGFGYLLPSLLAVKMHDKSIPERITRTTVQASLVGVAGASLVGFALTLVPQAWLWEPPEAEAAVVAEVPSLSGGLVEQLRADKIEMYRRRGSGGAQVTPLQREIDAFKRGLHDLRSYGSYGRAGDLRQARTTLYAAGFDLLAMEEGLFYLRELPPRLGRGLYVLRAGAENRLALEVPFPLEEWATLESAAYLFRFLDAGALAVATLPSPRANSNELSVLDDRRSFFHAFHQVFGLRGTLQVRGYSTRFFRQCAARWGLEGEEPAVPSSLWVTSALPEGVSPSDLRAFLGSLSVEWEASPFRNVHRDASRGAFGELFLRREDRKRLLARFLLGDEAFRHATEQDSGVVPTDIEGEPTLEAWVPQLSLRLAPRGSNLYQMPPRESLLFLDEEILQPLVRLVLRSGERRVSPREVASELPTVRAAAAALGYTLLRYHDPVADEEYLILTEDSARDSRRYWGTYIFRLWEHAPYTVEIPRPAYERSTLEYGAVLFRNLRGAFLLIAGTHPRCNTDGSGDMVQAENKQSVFNLVNQVVLRESDVTPMAVVQVRAFGHKAGALLPEGDALLSFHDGSASESEVTELGRVLLSAIGEDLPEVRFVDGSRETIGYEAHTSAQARYLSHTSNKELAALWLSPYMRVDYRQETDSYRTEAQFSVLGVRTVRGTLQEQLLARDVVSSLSSRERRRLESAITRYQVTRDVNILQDVASVRSDLELVRVIDEQSRKSFLLILQEGRLVPLVARMTLRRSLFHELEKHQRTSSVETLTSENVRRFVESTSAFLAWEEAR